MYVPPSKREGNTSKPETSPEDAASKLDGKQYTKMTIGAHFTHPQDSTFTLFSHYPSAAAEAARAPYDAARKPEETVLPSSPVVEPTHPLSHLISYIVIFRNAHPDWESNNEIWVHTHAAMMMADYEGKKVNFGRPIPVFKESHRKRSIAFVGW
jgi:hypothetical protein